ncbi:MAG: ATP-binding cassette domain-containing protein [Bauldia sp.]|nr:ATP-binding cassette domain-containing protein [Bauldia sp.]
MSAADAATREPVLAVRGLTVALGGAVVLRDLDLDVFRGEILGVVGASGAGKSVLLRAILGLLPIQSGTVSLAGGRGRGGGPDRRIGVLFQHGALFSSLTVRENIEVPMREHLRLSQPLMDELALLKLDLVGLPRSAAEKMPAELSGGMIKRASLARALALDPQIVFLDEPTSGLDPIGASEFDRLIGTLRDALGLTVFMVTHDLDSLRAVCDRIAVLGDGRILVEGSLAVVTAFDHPWVRSYFSGERARLALRAG